VGLFGAATTPILVGTLALVVAAGGGAVVASQDAPIPETLVSTTVEETGEDDTHQAEAADQAPIVPLDASGLPVDDPANIPGDLGDTVGGVVDGVGGVVDGVEDGILDPVLETVLPIVHADITITGTGTPGATVTASADGIASVSTTVGGNGTFALVVSGLPGDVASVNVSQDTSGLLLGGLLGQLIPLRLDSGGVLDVVFNLLG
jgi:hypothetical protein